MKSIPEGIMESICKVYKIYKCHYIRHPIGNSRRHFSNYFIGHSIVYSIGYSIK